jgi:hypothetical protein
MGVCSSGCKFVGTHLALVQQEASVAIQTSAVELLKTTHLGYELEKVASREGARMLTSRLSAAQIQELYNASSCYFRGEWPFGKVISERLSKCDINSEECDEWMTVAENVLEDDMHSFRIGRRILDVVKLPDALYERYLVKGLNALQSAAVVARSNLWASHEAFQVALVTFWSALFMLNAARCREWIPELARVRFSFDFYDTATEIYRHRNSALQIVRPSS